jgi:hypothetical protein
LGEIEMQFYFFKMCIFESFIYKEITRITLIK